MIFLFLMVRVLYPLWTLYISLRHLSLTVSTSPFLVVSADQYLVFQWVLNVFSSSQTLLQRAILVERNRDQKPRRETSGASNVLDLLFFAWKIMGISCNKSWSMVGYLCIYVCIYVCIYIHTTLYSHQHGNLGLYTTTSVICVFFAQWIYPESTC